MRNTVGPRTQTRTRTRKKLAHGVNNLPAIAKTLCIKLKRRPQRDGQMPDSIGAASRVSVPVHRNNIVLAAPDDGDLLVVATMKDMLNERPRTGF